jgi:hypothetical protein
MRKVVTSLGMAVVCAVALRAQDTKTTTTVKSDSGDAKTVTYSGCVQSGAEAKSFVLAKAMPVSQSTTTEVGTSGTTTSTTTTYMLVPGEKIELQPQVGHQVEITGVMVPAGDSKVETKTQVEREGAPDSKTTETVKSDNAMPQFRVTSVKEIAASCK